MGSTTPFWIAFVSTVALLAVSLWSGLRGRRRIHLLTGPLTMVALTIAIVLTEELMAGYSFPEGTLAFHLVFAKAGALLALPVVVTGLWLYRSPRARRWHRAAVLLWIVAVLVATGTGFWLFFQGTAKG